MVAAPRSTSASRESCSGKSSCCLRMRKERGVCLVCCAVAVSAIGNTVGAKARVAAEEQSSLRGTSNTSPYPFSSLVLIQSVHELRRFFPNASTRYSNLRTHDVESNPMQCSTIPSAAMPYLLYSSGAIASTEVV